MLKDGSDGENEKTPIIARAENITINIPKIFLALCLNFSIFSVVRISSKFIVKTPYTSIKNPCKSAFVAKSLQRTLKIE